MLPQSESGPSIQMLDIIEDMVQQKISLPCIIRFQDILRDRVVRLNQTFSKVLEDLKYQGSYRGVYPIKVNQLREVIEETTGIAHNGGQITHQGVPAVHWGAINQRKAARLLHRRLRAPGRRHRGPAWPWLLDLHRQTSTRAKPHACATMKFPTSPTAIW